MIMTYREEIPKGREGSWTAGSLLKMLIIERISRFHDQV
jgi:hypothetical protein